MIPSRSKRSREPSTAPAAQTVTVTGGQLTTIIYTYQEDVVADPLDAWRLENFQTTSNTGDSADDADPDKDGRKNIEEYTAGTDPNAAGEFLRMTDPSDPADLLRPGCGNRRT